MKTSDSLIDYKNGLIVQACNLVNADNYIGAINLYREILKIDQVNCDALINISDCYLKLEMASTALPFAEKAYFLYRSIDDMANVNYSSALIGLKEYRNAIKILEEAKAQDSGNDLIYNNLGYAYFLVDDFFNALDNYCISIAILEKNPLAYCNRGVLKYFIFNDDSGLDDLKKATEYGDREAQMILQEFTTSENQLN